jgi:ribulose-phosphate 3-epimerase
MSTSIVKLAPSILAADFARLGEQVREAEQAGADRIHVDVMDGHFVPNISMGPVVVKALRPLTKLPLEVHLMIEHPIRFLDAFAEAGADGLLVHVENAANLHRTVQHIKALGKKAGVVLNPATSPVALAELLSDIDLVLVMTVNPGFGGQKFIATMLDKVRRVRRLIDQTNRDIELEVDGGIDAETTTQVVSAGARVLVAGSAIFGASEGVAAAMNRLRTAILPVFPS